MSNLKKIIEIDWHVRAHGPQTERNCERICDLLALRPFSHMTQKTLSFLHSTEIKQRTKTTLIHTLRSNSTTNFRPAARAYSKRFTVTGEAGVSLVLIKPFLLFTDSKFGVSRFTKKKNVFIRSVFITLVKRTTAKELPCSMSSPFSRFLFLVLLKGKESRDLPSNGSLG